MISCFVFEMLFGLFDLSHANGAQFPVAATLGGGIPFTGWAL